MMRAVVALAVLIAATPALAQSPLCGKRAELTAQLAQRYNEEPVGMGLSNNGALLELFSAPGGKTWTIMISQPNGQSCLISAGEGWEGLKPKGSNT